MSCFFKVDKKLYSLECIQAAVLSFSDIGCDIEDAVDFWSVKLLSKENLIEESTFFRILNEYALRETLAKKFNAEKEAIYNLAFGRD